ncbi:MAG: hypothetical protein ABIH38_02975 [Patescibacteria group bacterium]
MKDQKGFSLKELIIFTGLLLIVIIFGVLLLNQERARTRDAKRMADMAQVRFGFEVLFNETNSYAQAGEGCRQVGSLVSACDLSAYLANIAQIKDPGKYQYQVTKVPGEKDFEVTFTLEKGYDRLAKGKHTLSAEGIK